MQEPWYTKPMRIAAFQWDLEGRTFEAPEKAAAAGFNVEQVCHLLEDGSLAEMYRPDKHEEKLARYVALSKAHGTRLIVTTECQQHDAKTNWCPNSQAQQSHFSFSPI